MNFSVNTISSWFNYIRENPEDKRFLECFWDTQLRSKEEILDFYPQDEHGTCYVFGGWYGILPKMILDNHYPFKVYSIDIDPNCERVGNIYFRHQFDELQFVTADMKDFQYRETPDVIINTSTEHVDQETYDIWWDNIPDDTFVMLQGNDLVIPEHVRPFDSIEDFASRNRAVKSMEVSQLELPGPNDTTYRRFTLTGFK